jgi:hypothetical protein
VPWQLEIHHIDLWRSGDSTLIIARQVAPIGPGPAIRSVLIDGGLQMAAPHVDAYIAARLGAAQLNAIICTHYDRDHMNGLTSLLRMAVGGRYNNVTIYDQGWPANAGADADIVRYLNAINGRSAVGAAIPALGVLARSRPTSTVASGGGLPFAVPAVGGAPAVPAGGLFAIVDPPHWLLTDPAAPQDPLWHGAGVAVPAGAPTMRFIAANAYVRTAAGGTAGPLLGLGTDPKNEKSLAVEVTFGNFRYYAGGDIETPQENSIQTLLNNANNAAGRVLAFKTSHHGAATATAPGFVDRLRPSAAFISSGTANQHNHPFPQVINTLDGYARLLALHPPAPPPPVARPVKQYLTGYGTVGPPVTTYGGDASMTAGRPVPRVHGDIVLTVDAAQSAAPVQGQLFAAVQAAVLTALTTPGLGGVMLAAAAAPIAAAAAENAMVQGPADTASWLITQGGGPAAAGVAALNAANGPLPGGAPAIAMAAVVSMAARLAGAPTAWAAAAGAAAGTCTGDGTVLSVHGAVAGALVGANLPGGFAAALPFGAAAVVGLAPPVQFTVRLWWLLRAAGPGNVSVPHR